MLFSRLAGLSFIGKASSDDVDYTFDVLGRFLFWRWSLTPLWMWSLSASVFCSSLICFLVPMLLLLMSFESRSCLIIVWSLNKLG